jgi:hypothetical protein
MSSANNGQQQGHGGPERQLRFHGGPAISAWGSSRLGNPALKSAIARLLPEGYSGRRFVIGAACTILAIWGLLYLFFREWRAEYRARALYGATQVVPAIDPFASIVPPKIDPIAWRDAVKQTHAMLLTVTSSNLLGKKQMEELQTELDQAVARARARPSTALDELAGIWNKMDDRGGFLLRAERYPDRQRHARPAILPPAARGR